MKKRKVLFIDPKEEEPHVFSWYLLPRLGSLGLGTILQNKGHNVEVYVEGISRKPTIHPDIIGISTITTTANKAYKIADNYREKGIPVMIGGSHVSALPEEAIQHADYVVVGEGENVIEDIVEGNLKPGIIQGPPVKNLDELPNLDLGLLRPRTTPSRLVKNIITGTIVPISTSRGCSHDCEFCCVTKMFGRKYRAQTPERVLEQIEATAKPGEKVFFYDDNFPLNEKRTVEICEGMIRQQERTRRRNWSTQAEVNVGSKPELLKLMKKSGCNILYIGFESINPSSLKGYGKRQTVEQMDECVARLREVGIYLHAMFVLGADTDYPETIGKTLEFCRTGKIPTVQFMILTPIPGTDTRKRLEKEGRISNNNWDFYTGHHTLFKPKNMSAEYLERETMANMRKFYSKWEGFKKGIQFKIPDAFFRFMGNYYIKSWQKMYQQV